MRLEFRYKMIAYTELNKTIFPKLKRKEQIQGSKYVCVREKEREQRDI